jgi:hypothetical protein
MRNVLSALTLTTVLAALATAAVLFAKEWSRRHARRANGSTGCAIRTWWKSVTVAGILVKSAHYDGPAENCELRPGMFRFLSAWRPQLKQLLLIWTNQLQDMLSQIHLY